MRPLPVTRAATYDDLIALPDNLIGEIIDGELIASPRPAGPHARASISLGADLTWPFDFGRGGPGGWWFLCEPELHFGKQVLVPDLAGWRRERMPPSQNVAYFTLAPAWVCEIVSPSSARIDRVRKMPVYHAAEVQHVWLIDPRSRVLEVYRRAEGYWTLLSSHAGDERVRAEPFDAVELALDDLWLAEEATP